MSGYYEILGVKKDASQEDIKSAYRNLAKQWHPDRNPGDSNAETKFKEIQEAYDALGDPAKRSQYDQTGTVGRQPPRRPNNSGFDPFQGFHPYPNRTGKGENINVRLDISLAEAQVGARKKVRFKRKGVCTKCRGVGGTSMAMCPSCNGLGSRTFSNPPFQINQICTPCQGRGTVNKDKCVDCLGTGFTPPQDVEYEIEIPAGFDSGMQIRIVGGGEPSRTSGSPAGDAYVVVFVSDHDVYRRVNRDLVTDVWIAYTDFVLGTTVKLKQMNGEEISFTVPAGTNPGSKIRLKGLGMRDQLGFVGDLICLLRLEVPDSLSEEYKAIIDQLARLEHENVTQHRKSFAENHK